MFCTALFVQLRLYMFPRYLRISLWIFTELLSLVHLGTEMNWLGFVAKRSKVRVTLSRLRHQHSTLPLSSAFWSALSIKFFVEYCDIDGFQ